MDFCSLAVCKGKSAPTALVLVILVCHHGASSSCYNQCTQPLQRWGLELHITCFDHRSQVKCIVLVTFFCGDCNKTNNIIIIHDIKIPSNGRLLEPGDL